MRQQDNQEHAPIKQQPQQETSSSTQSSKVIEQMRKQEARTEQQKHLFNSLIDHWFQQMVRFQPNNLIKKRHH
ncbi:hypothetical protein F3K44_31360 [Bacillus megaterium]|nr:hypothetical protein [Priestia megaterium]